MEGHWQFRHQIGDDDFDQKSTRLKDLGEHSIETFVREFIQNSLDVRYNKTKPVIITFEIKELDDEALINLRKNLTDDFLNMFRKSFEKADIDERSKLQAGYNMLFNTGCGFSLIITETNCVGLTGPERLTSNKDISNYDALCRKVNKNEKEDSNSGGTWGKGSSIYTFSSQIRTWFAYSILSDKWQGQRKRFIGRSQLAPFIDYDSDPPRCYFGTGWLCRKEEDENIRGLPLTGTLADDYANRFGMKLRSEDDYGTSFYVPGFNPNLNDADVDSVFKEFEKQALLNWFIPIYEQKLEVRIRNKSQEVIISKDYLYDVDQLKYKLEILDWYYKDRPENDQIYMEVIKSDIPALREDQRKDRRIEYADKPKSVRSDLIIRKLEEFEKYNNSWDTINKVALVRGNNGFFVDCHDPRLTFLDEQKVRTESILFCGLMVKDDIDANAKRHADLFFAYSENPDHNQWCYQDSKINNESYLDRFEEIPPQGKGRWAKPTRAIRELLWSKLPNSFREFFQVSKEIESGNDINQVFQKLAGLGVKGASHKREILVNLTRNGRYNEPEIDEEGKFIYHRIINLVNSETVVNVSFQAAFATWEDSDASYFKEVGIPDFEVLEILNDDDNSVIDIGSNPSLTLDEDNSEVRIAVRTCPIWTNRAFQNLQPKIKVLVTEE